MILTPSSPKHRLRQEALARRDALDPERRAEMSRQAARFHPEIRFEPETIISGFLPIRSEIDARPLMNQFLRRGARLCVPAVIDRKTIHFREWLPDAKLVEAGFGTKAPGAEAQILVPRIMIVPLAAFDSAGHRIGYGAGYYDGAIDSIRSAGKEALCIGLGFSIQEIEEIPVEPHDRPLDSVLTEREYRRFV